MQPESVLSQVAPDFGARARSVRQVVNRPIHGLGVACLLPQRLEFGGREPGPDMQIPPLAEVFLGIGAGLLSSAAILVLLFYLPWSKKPPSIRERDKDDSSREIR